jgi:hypothetical protein
LATIAGPVALAGRLSVSSVLMRGLAEALLIGVGSAVAVVWVGWWGIPIVLGLVLAWGWVERRTGRAPQLAPGELARRVPGALLFAGGVFGVFLVANTLFDGTAAFFAWWGTIFAFWVVCCVILPRRNARTPRPQR